MVHVLIYRINSHDGHWGVGFYVHVSNTGVLYISVPIQCWSCPQGLKASWSIMDQCSRSYYGKTNLPEVRTGFYLLPNSFPIKISLRQNSRIPSTAESSSNSPSFLRPAPRLPAPQTTTQGILATTLSAGACK